MREETNIDTIEITKNGTPIELSEMTINDIIRTITGLGAER